MLKLAARLTLVIGLIILAIISLTVFYGNNSQAPVLALQIDSFNRSDYSWTRATHLYDTVQRRTLPLTSPGYIFNGTEHCLTWSPDRKWLFFCHDHKFYAHDNITIGMLELMHLDRVIYMGSMTPMQLYEYDMREDQMQVEWSPDSRYFVFYANRDIGRVLRLFDLTTGNASDLPPSKHLENEYGSVPEFDGRWSPDSRYLIYTAETGSTTIIFADNPTSPIDIGEMTAKRELFSLDGRYLLFQRITSENAVLFIFDSHNRSITELGACETWWQGTDYCADVTWSPDSKTFTYYTETGTTALMSFDESGIPQPVVELPAGHVTWSPDSSTMAIESMAGLTIADSGGIVDVLEDVYIDRADVKWLPDSRLLVFVSQLPEDTEIVSYDLDTRSQRVLLLEGIYAHHVQLQVLPDGFLYMIAPYSETPNRVYRVEGDQAPQLLWEDTRQFYGLYFIGFYDHYALFATGFIQDDIHSSLYVIDLDTGKTSHIETRNTFQLQDCGLDVPLISIDAPDEHFDFRGLYKIDLAAAQLEQWFDENVAVICK